MNTRLVSDTLSPLPAWPGMADDPSIPSVLPVEPGEQPAVEADEHSLLGLFELLLKDPARVDQLNRDPARQVELVPRFLFLALGSYLFFSAALVVLLCLAPPAAYPHSLLSIPRVQWDDGSALAVVGAYSVGLVLATGVCLPSFYFYGLLSGIQLTMLQIVACVLKGKAEGAILLVGLMPVYVAPILGAVVFEAPPETLEVWLHLGLVLPFLAGLWGLRAIYRAVLGLADTLPPERRCRRTCFLRRLTLAWAACYAAVSPVMIYRLWEFFAGHAV